MNSKLKKIIKQCFFHQNGNRRFQYVVIDYKDTYFVMGMVGEACLPSNVYYTRTPGYTLYSWDHVCWSEHSDSSFIYGFMSLDYGLGTMIATTYESDFMKSLSRENQAFNSTSRYLDDLLNINHLVKVNIVNIYFD